MKSKGLFGSVHLFLIFALSVLLTGDAFAYIDPGSLGSAYQFGYLIFYSVLGILIFFFRPIKNFFVFLFNSITGKKNRESEILEENPQKDEA